MSNEKVPDENFTYVPLPPQLQEVPGLNADNDLLLMVDGETFAVHAARHNSIHYTWISGPNNGYGFSALGTNQTPTDIQHIAAIREFLAGIDPSTGFLQD
ncbi:hypothetical protein [Glutamicibacter halophytocola]|uniref:Uncharacterized protein n=1 Tax=Glutamicibacter halophytocola TaxID=1933880 RepID=A0AA95BSY4_9MICC|nr:hypothetical protein [Glutamicibacter halophytocola]UUX59877.1 hypothetical protein NUH22_04440 [Glutamicibacter halophytocola]